MKNLLKEFKEFALRGNVVDLAVGVIIGSAFREIVTSLVEDVISPVLGFFARKEFNSLKLSVLGVDIRYGAFITAVINFIIMAFLIFLLVKGMNKLASIGKGSEEATDVESDKKECPFCITEIPAKASRCPNCTSNLQER